MSSAWLAALIVAIAIVALFFAHALLRRQASEQEPEE
jgi:hypothetical protein